MTDVEFGKPELRTSVCFGLPTVVDVAFRAITSGMLQ